MLINNRTKKKVSLFGRILHNIEKKICNNFRLFIGRHEKTFDIIFLSIFVFLQIWIAFITKEPYVILIIVIFLFFLSLDRIFVHIWLDFERKKFQRKELKIKNKINTLRNFYAKDREKLIKKIERLKSKKKR